MVVDVVGSGSSYHAHDHSFRQGKALKQRAWIAWKQQGRVREGEVAWPVQSGKRGKQISNLLVAGRGKRGAC